MRQIDLTTKLTREKGARVCYHSVYLCPPFYGFLDTGDMSTGIAFIKATRDGIRTHKNGSPRWYFGNSSTLAKARTNARKNYSMSIPQTGWIRARVKTWNNTSVGEIVELLKSHTP